MKKLLMILVFTIATIFIALPACNKRHNLTADNPVDTTNTKAGYMKTSGTQFYLDDLKYKVVGCNYHILQVASHIQIDNAFTYEIPGMHLNTIRFFGFWMGKNGNAFNIATEPNPRNIIFQDYVNGVQVFNDGENGLQNIDYCMYQAKLKGIKVIYVLNDNWAYQGGIPEYLDWVGKSNATQHDEFFSDNRLKTLYKDWVSHLLNHVNYYTGLAYKDDPTIMAWELCNEPNAANGKYNLLNSWAEEMSKYIKSIDQNHLVCMGDVGFFNWGSTYEWAYRGADLGLDFDALIAIPSIDFGTCHAYPMYDGHEKDPSWNVTKFIPDHIARAKAVNKPVLFEEFGWSSKDTSVIRPWLTAIYKNDGAGWCFWDGCAKDGKGNTGNYTVSGGYADDIGYKGFATPYNSTLGSMYKTQADYLLTLEGVKPK